MWVADLRLLQWLTVDVNSALGWLGRVDVGNVASILEAYTASIVRVQMRRVGEFLCICRFMFRKTYGGGGIWGWWPVWASKNCGQGKSCREWVGPLRVSEWAKRPSESGVPKRWPVQGCSENVAKARKKSVHLYRDCRGTSSRHQQQCAELHFLWLQRNILYLTEAIKLFRFLMVGTSSNVQNCTICDCRGTFYNLQRL
jgi:hypothetical protein